MGLARATARKNRGQDRFEREKIAFHRKVREGYLNLARENPKRFVVLDGTAEKGALEREIFSHLKPLLGTQGNE
jgi:dTMP kinase